MPNSEGIAREIFSSRCYRADGRVVPNAFGFNRAKDNAFSVNRISLAPEAFFQYLGLKHAKRRKLTFHGSAQLTAQNIRSVVMDDLWGANVLGSPTKENPFHADIPYPPDHGRDYDMAVQIQLANLSVFQPYRNAK
ncbi:MAG: hypothetical protein KF771_02770 [Burkholderiales bacterium]|nr:hypothetical protein [Burkholderiales bacterium]